MSGPPGGYPLALCARAAAIALVLILASLGQFTLVQEASHLEERGQALAEVTFEEQAAIVTIQASAEVLASELTGDPADRARERMLAAEATLKSAHEQRLAVVDELGGPPLPRELGALTQALSDRVQALADAPLVSTDAAAREVQLSGARLATSLTQDQDQREQAIAAETVSHKAAGYALLSGIIVLLSVGAVYVAHPAGKYVQRVRAAAQAREAELSEAMATQKEQAEAHARELEQTIEELRQFAYVASHDLQEPLRMVSSYIQLIERRIGGQLDEDTEVFMGYVQEGAHRMKQLIDDLLVYSQVGAEDRALGPVHLEDPLNEAQANLRVSIAEVNGVVTHDELPHVMGDASQLTQLFQNLLSNALKFRAPERSPRVHVGAERLDEGTWQITVSDNGIGIDPGQEERIFTIFQRAQARDAYPGTGIGLAICRKIVERHGGTIHALPRDHPEAEWRGAAMVFTLTEAPSDSQGQPEPPAPQPRTLRDRSTELI